MRQCTVVLAFSWIFLQSIAAQTVRVATCELEGVEATPPDALPSDPQVQRLWHFAENLRSTEAEIIILHGIPDQQTARRLVVCLKPSTYQVALQSTFKKAGANDAAVGSALTILSKKQPFAAR